MMSHTYSALLVHCVFSTKDRRALITEPERLWQYFGGIARARNIPLVAAGGTANHVHLLLDLPTTVPMSEALQHLKGSSSHWLKQQKAAFAWQQGYGAFAIGQSQRQTMIAYIARQPEHHRKWSFEQEFETLLRRYGIQYDRRFMFG